MVAYPASLTLPYRVADSWVEEQTLAGEIVGARYSLVIDIERLQPSHRSAAVELALTIDSRPREVGRTPTIAGSGIDPEAGKDGDFLDGPILQEIGHLPELPAASAEPEDVIDAWVVWVARYKASAHDALEEFVGVWHVDAGPDDDGRLANGADVSWWNERITVAVPGDDEETFTLDGRCDPELFLEARGARQLLDYVRRVADDEDLRLAGEVVGTRATALDDQPEIVVPAFREYAQRFSRLAFARFWTRQRRRAGFELEMGRWTAASGSERLRLGLEDGYRMIPVYLNERIAAEVPGFYAYLPPKDGVKIWQERTGPSEEGLRLRRAVQERLSTTAEESPEVFIGWVKDPPNAMCDAEKRMVHEFDGDSWEREDAFEAIVVPDWLGRYLLIAAVWTADEDRPPDYILSKHILQPTDYGLDDLPSPRGSDFTSTFAPAPADDDIPF